MSHKREIHVHVHQHLGIEGRLAAYELLDPNWQLNVINIDVLFGDAKDTFFEHLMEAHRQLAMMEPTITIGDFNAAPTIDSGPASFDVIVTPRLTRNYPDAFLTPP